MMTAGDLGVRSLYISSDLHYLIFSEVKIKVACLVSVFIFYELGSVTTKHHCQYSLSRPLHKVKNNGR